MKKTLFLALALCFASTLALAADTSKSDNKEDVTESESVVIVESESAPEMSEADATEQTQDEATEDASTKSCDVQK